MTDRMTLKSPVDPTGTEEPGAGERTTEGRDLLLTVQAQLGHPHVHIPSSASQCSLQEGLVPPLLTH